MKPQHNPEQTVFNCSRYVFSEAEKSLLLKGFNFGIAPKKLNDYLVN